MYRVKVYFTDLQDNGKPYYPGEIYPRAGLTVSEERLKELSGTNNKRHVALIAYIPEKSGINTEQPESKSDETEKQEKASLRKRKAKQND